PRSSKKGKIRASWLQTFLPKACLASFLLAEDAPWPDEHVERDAGANKLATLRAELSERYLCGLFSTPDELAAIASAAIVRNLDLGRAPFDAQREHRLIKSWRATNTLSGLG
ncbi:MAG: hypothetical protein WCE49_06835, partial [Terrimicrobiaceae bacterium]